MHSVVTSALLVIGLCGCGKTAFVNRTNAMSPTILPGEKIYADMDAYRDNPPKRWDIVLFKPPETFRQSDDDSQLWTFRVIGLPGENISFDDAGVTANDLPLSTPPHLEGISYRQLDMLYYGMPARAPSYPYKVPEDSYFLLGDNTANANDSRFWGALPRANIVGKVLGKK